VPSKIGLGKGLDALIPNFEGSQESGKAATERSVPVSAIKPNPRQPRHSFDEAALAELAESIKANGVIQPIIVEDEGSGSYLIIAGERRFRAARMAGLDAVPVLVRKYTNQQKLEIALVENVQREDLNPVEEAEAYRGLMEVIGASQDEVAARVGKDRSTVANALRLLKLPETMLAALEKKDMSSGHGRALLSVVNPADRELLFERIAEKGLSVREAERAAAELNAGKRGAAKKPAAEGRRKDPEIKSIEERMIAALGTKVVVKGDGRKGTISISYFSTDDLDRLYAILGIPTGEKDLD
jgi:ParB family transcriptional regulator, chromosome partitioning protein